MLRAAQHRSRVVRHSAFEFGPHAEIRPIMFMGTYDEHNWRVLKDRWQQLRGQLHGIVISEHELHGATPEQITLAREVNDWAPRLSPR